MLHCYFSTRKILCITYSTPQVIWMFNIVDYSPPTYNAGKYTFPPWGLAIGWGVAATSLAAIALGAAHALATADATGSGGSWPPLAWRLRVALRPTIESCPCGCESALDHNFEAHASPLFSACADDADVTGPVMADADEEAGCSKIEVG